MQIKYLPTLLILIVSLGICTLNSFAQQEANIWYFGWNGGIDFNSGAPVALTNSNMRTDEGCSSIADATGNLLFYTDGSSVWNKAHAVMPNGSGLMGASSSSQSALIVPKPGSTTMYYIFTAPVYTAPGTVGVRYSEVDMSLAGGNGSVIAATKNTFLFGNATEQLAGVRHSNGTDVWVISRSNNSNDIYAYLVTNTGIASPVISSCGQGFNVNFWGGYLKASPDGSKLASALVNLPSVEIYNFNNTTGVISFAFSLPNTPNSYAASFSPDNSRLYVETGINVVQQSIYQYNMLAGCGNPASIIASRTLISTSIENFGAIQMATDGKGYITRYTIDTLAVINNPNLLGLACNFVNSGFPVIGSLGPVRHGLPNFIETYFGSPTAVLSATVTSTNATCGAGNGSATVTPTGGPSPYTYAWVPIGGTGPLATGLSAGNYTCTITDANGCTKTTSVTITSVNNGPAVSVSAQTNILCNGDSSGNASITSAGGTAPYTYAWSPAGGTNATATGLIAGAYSVTVTDSAGCISSQTVVITEPPALTAITGSTPATCDSSTGTATASPLGGTSGYLYLWNNGQTDQTAIGLASGNYSVTITDANGCTRGENLTVGRIPCPCPELQLPNAFSPNNDGENDEFCLQGGNADCIESVHITIYNRWGETVYHSSEENFCWDGTYQGDRMNTAVFVYYLEGSLKGREKVARKGNISLIR